MIFHGGRNWIYLLWSWTLTTTSMKTKCWGLEHDNNDSICGGVIVNRRKGVIESPNYPIRYPERSRCDWLIRTPNADDVIELRFVDIQIETSTLCLFDYVEISHIVGTSPRRYCSPTSEVARSRGNLVHIRFVSDSADSREGFRIAYRVVKQPSTAYQTTTTFPVTTVPQTTESSTVSHVNVTSIASTQSTAELTKEVVSSPESPKGTTFVETLYSRSPTDQAHDQSENINAFEIRPNAGVNDYRQEILPTKIDTSLYPWQIVLIAVTATSCAALLSIVGFIYLGSRKSTSFHRGQQSRINGFS